jgi:hypothetical protein
MSLLDRLERSARGCHGAGAPGVPKPGMAAPPPLPGEGFAETWGALAPLARGTEAAEATSDRTGDRVGDGSTRPSEPPINVSPAKSPAAPRRRSAAAAAPRAESAADEMSGTWEVSVPPRWGRGLAAGALLPAALVAPALRTAEDAPASPSGPAASAVVPPPRTLAPAPRLQPEPQPAPPVPARGPEAALPAPPADGRDGARRGEGGALSIGTVDIRITPPPKPEAKTPPARAPRIKRDRHAEGVSAASLWRRSGLGRL